MGNTCGCVRAPREECYRDPKKAPLSLGSKELKGRRYFQRKKRKSEALQPAGSPRRPASDDITTKAVCSNSEPQDGPGGKLEESKAELDKPSEVKKHLSRQESLGTAVCGDEVPALVPRNPCNQSNKGSARRLGRFPPEQKEDNGSRSTAGGKLWCINEDGLLAEKLQLRRAVSFGAVEPVLQTLRGNDRPGREETFAQIICGAQAHGRRRRRAYTCSAYVQHPAGPAKCISTQNKVNCNHLDFKALHWGKIQHEHRLAGV